MRALPISFIILALLAHVAFGIQDVAPSATKRLGRTKEDTPHLQDQSPLLLPSFKEQKPYSKAIHCVSNVIRHVEYGLQECYDNFVVGVSQAFRTLAIRLVLSDLFRTALEVALKITFQLVDSLSPGSRASTQLALIKRIMLVDTLATRAVQVILSPVFFLRRVVREAMPMSLLALMPESLFSVFKQILNVHTLVTSDLPAQDVEASDLADYRFLASGSSEVYKKMAKVSIHEEIIFRCVLNWPLWLYGRLMTCSDDKGSKTQRETQENTASMYRRQWVLFTAFCFGVLHIGNSLRPGIEDASLDCQSYSIVLALVQSTSCFLNSVFLYNPLAEKHGLAAAIGAHVCGNMLIALSLEEENDF